MEKSYHLKENYFLVPTSKPQFSAFFREHEKNIFTIREKEDFSNLYSEEEKILLKQLSQTSNFELHFFVLYNEEKIGWSAGLQSETGVFKMVSSAIFQEHRRKGLYSLMLIKILSILKEKGFNKVESNHHIANNEVIIPKLKSGFIITGILLHERFGTLVQLTYYFNIKLKKLAMYRSGFAFADDEVKNVLGCI